MMVKIIICGILIFSLTACNTVEDSSDSFPDIISGQVKNENGQALDGARISLLTASKDPVYSSNGGFFRIENIDKKQHRIKVEMIGYKDYEAEVPKAINGTSTINPVMLRKDLSVPPQKPLSKGKVRVNGKVLETDFDGDGVYTPYYIKGVAYSPVPIGNKPLTPAGLQRSIQYLIDLNANTIRTYSGAGKDLLDACEAAGIKVIVSFWVAYEFDLSQESVRQDVKTRFGQMVFDLKNHPAVLMWNLGNEQNYMNGNNPEWYSLAQEMAVYAYQIEGETYRPVMINNGNLFNIGSPSFLADDASLSYVDLWGTNTYEYTFTPFFATYRSRSVKPIVITEFGIDALDNRNKTEYEDVQAVFDSLNWSQIKAASDICVGGTVFEYTDEWWKAGDPFSHDYGGYPTGAHPDGFSNEEWWGLIAVTPDSDGDGLDDWRPRKAYYMFQRNWKD